jgi:outer membrane protein insertion porin family
MKKAFLVLVVAGIGLCPTSLLLYAQRTPTQEVSKVLGISVEGNKYADPAAVIANSGLKVGEDIAYPGDQIGQAVRKLWSLRIFSDVQIAIDRKAGDGVFLVIRVVELPRYDGILIEGEDAIDEGDIMKKLNLIKGQVFSPQDAVKIRKEMKKLYEEKGYLLATVDATTQPSDSSQDRVLVKVNINEGKEVQVDRIEFEGDTAFANSDLRGAMDETQEKTWWKIFSSAKFDKKKYEEDKKKIVEFYRKNGYRDAEILSDSISYSPEKQDLYILIRVREGQQYRIRKIIWQGNTVFSSDVLNDRLNMYPGDVYDMKKFEQNLRGNESQSDVASLYLDNGYLRLNLEPVETRVGENEVDIAINVYEMNQFKLGQVSVKGNTKTWEKVVRRELYTRPGDYFSRSAIIRSLRQLSVLNYFNQEKLKPDYVLVDDKTVDLSYEVEEKSSDNVNASIGYSGAYGFMGALGFTINNFSIGQPFTGGAGQILNFEWQFGEGSRFRTFTIGFTEPWLFDTPTLFGASLFDTRQIYNFDLRQTGGSVKFGRRFRWPDDYFRGDLILSAQHNNVSDGRGIYQEGVTSQVSATVIVSRNSIDNPVFPSQGSDISLSVQMSGGPLLPGDIDFHKWMFNANWFVPIFGTNRVTLLLGTQFGLIQPFYRNSIIPPIDLFFMGGTIMGYGTNIPLRGYVEQSVGPRNQYGQIVGGRAFIKNTMEFRISLTMNPIPIYILSFLEAGNVFESWATADFFSLKQSAGFGARVQIQPIGLIGFDYGYGFDDVFPKDGRPDGWHFHFVFGRGF